LGLEQNDKGYGRKITFGDSISLEFQNREIVFGQQFDNLLLKFQTKSLFSEVYYKVSIDTELILSAMLDFGTVTTDKTNYLKCDAVINDSNRYLNELGDIEVNLLSTLSLQQKAISAINTEPVKLKAKDILSSNVYDLANGGKTYDISGGYSFYLLPLKTISKQIITTNELNSFFTNDDIWQLNPSTTIGSQFDPFLKTSNIYYHIQTLIPQKLTLSITGIIIEALAIDYVKSGIVDTFNGTYTPDVVYQGHIDEVTFEVIIQSFANPEFTGTPIITSLKKTYTPSLSSNLTVDLTNLEFNFDNHIFELMSNSRLSFNIHSTVSGGYPGSSSDLDYPIPATGTLKITGSGGMKIYGTDAYVDTTANMSRLYDMGNQLLTSINPIYTGLTAPKLQLGGFLYDIFCCNGYSIRNFPQTVYGWKMTWNDYLDNIRNQFNFDYQINDGEVFIGHHSDFYKDIEVARLDFNPIASSFSVSVNPKNKTKKLEFNYKTFQDIQENKDNTIDSVHTQSSWMVNGGNQKETETKEIGFIADAYKIEYARREGLSVEPGKSKQTDDETYVIDCFKQVDETYKNRSNEGFSTVINYSSPQTAYNLRLSLKRLLLDNYSEYLANLTQLIVNKVKLLNTFYKLNGIMKSQASIAGTTSILIKENENIDTFVTPLITTHFYDIELSVRFNFKDYYNLLQSILDKKGYLNLVDTETFASLKIFPTSIVYDSKNEKLNIKGEQKYE